LLGAYPAVPLFLFSLLQQQGILQQFNLAKEINEEEVEELAPFQPLAEQDFP